jgi:putative ABC transport system permease protein
MQIQSISDVVEQSMSMERFLAILLMIFGSSALLIAMVGLFGILEYERISRARELALRSALGATPIQLQRLLASRGVALLLVAASAGLLLSVASTRLLQHFLYLSHAAELAVISLVTTCLTLFAAAVILLSARRAGSMSPATMLRQDWR